VLSLARKRPRWWVGRADFWRLKKRLSSAGLRRRWKQFAQTPVVNPIESPVVLADRFGPFGDSIVPPVVTAGVVATISTETPPSDQPVTQPETSIEEIKAPATLIDTSVVLEEVMRRPGDDARLRALLAEVRGEWDRHLSAAIGEGSGDEALTQGRARR